MSKKDKEWEEILELKKRLDTLIEIIPLVTQEIFGIKKRVCSQCHKTMVSNIDYCIECEKKLESKER